jgi:hypothetical protein
MGVTKTFVACGIAKKQLVNPNGRVAIAVPMLHFDAQKKTL